jgi:hypothetical protein
MESPYLQGPWFEETWFWTISGSFHVNWAFLTQWFQRLIDKLITYCFKSSPRFEKIYQIYVNIYVTTSKNCVPYHDPRVNDLNKLAFVLYVRNFHSNLSFLDPVVFEKKILRIFSLYEQVKTISPTVGLPNPLFL